MSIGGCDELYFLAVVIARYTCEQGPGSCDKGRTAGVVSYFQNSGPQRMSGRRRFQINDSYYHRQSKMKDRIQDDSYMDLKELEQMYDKIRL